MKALLTLFALAMAAVAVAAHGGRFDARLDALTHFSPVWLAGGLVALLAWAAFVRRGAAVPVLALIALAASLALMTPELLARRETTDGSPTLKIVQFNVWGRNASPEQTVRWILAQKADVVVVQEAYNAKVSVALQLKKHFTGRTTCAEPKQSCSTMIFYNAEPLAEGGLSGTGDEPFLAAGWVTLPGPAGPFTVVGAHYTWPWPPAPQQVQSRRLIEAVGRFPKATTILAGDFNLTPWSFALRRQDEALGLQRRTRALFSWPAARFTRFNLAAPFPVLPIDHVYAGDGWRTVSVERGPNLGSDHYPVVVVLTPAWPSPLTTAR